MARNLGQGPLRTRWEGRPHDCTAYRGGPRRYPGPVPHNVWQSGRSHTPRPVEADWHYFNLFTALVGESSKGRKGVSAGHPKRLLREVDAVWAQGRIMSGLSSGEGL